MRKIINTIKKDWLILLLILGTFAAGLYFYPYLPDMVPSHWNFKGQVDGYTSRFWGAYAIPMLNLGFYILFFIIPIIDPKRKNYESFSSTYKLFRYMIHIFFIGLYVITLLTALGFNVNITALLQAAASLLFALMGNVMGRIKHNYTFGIRTPWTLANEEVWRRTHRMAGPLWTVGGLIGFLTSFTSFGFLVLLFVLGVIILVPLIYSFVIYNKIGQ